MRFSRLVLVGVLAVGLAGGLWGWEDEVAPAASKPAVTSVPAVPAELRDLLEDRNFAAAVGWIDGELKAAKPSVAVDYLLYLKGRALFEQEQYDGATAAYELLEKNHPKSDWLARSRFGRAAVLAKKRDYQAAGAIYRQEAERLLSAGRRDELTAIYLEYADRYFTGVPARGPQPAQAPDFNQALNYYRQALTLRPSRSVRQRIELRIARSLQELNQHGEALAAYQQFLQTNSGDRVPEAQRAADALVAEAQFQLGQTQLDLGQPAEARKTWQDFLGSPVAAAAPDLITEATYRMARTYGVPQPPTVGDLELGVEALTKFVAAFPDHPLAAQAEYDHALSLLHHQRQEQAVAVLQALIANPKYAKAKQLPRAWNLLGQTYARQKKFDDAIQSWQKFLELYPTDPEWSNVQRQIVETEYLAAAELARLKQYAKAREAWETFLNKYPLDSRAPQILLQFGQMLRAQGDELKTAQKAPPKEAPDGEAKAGDKPATPQEFYEAAMLDWQRLLVKYPETGEASLAALLIGDTLEVALGRLADAVEAYRKVTGPHQGDAQQRLERLIAPHLEIVTERKFRSSEKAYLKLTTRNLPEVTLKLYRIDLADYFRKLHLASGVEQLDIALIDPDKSWTHKVEKFEPYRQITEQVEIPVEGPGVTAITVNSDRHEATTMVMVSDIDIIVKSSRNELFVFAENMLTGKPAGDVQLLLSDGGAVFGEVKTGKDGVYQGTFDKLKTISDLRVFATSGPHAASSQVSLNGLNFAVGLSAKGFLFTDRPAYRAGQLVHLKGFVRWVAEDRYTYKPGEKYQLDIYDSVGRVLHSESIQLDDFGTLATHWALPANAPAGSYRVHVHQPGREQSYETQFTVQEYQLEPIQFTIDLERSVYFRGEKVTGKLKLKYYYGTPLVGRTVQYKLGDDRLYTAQTDPQGEVAFELPTQRYSESQALPLVAHFPERNLTAGQTIHLATRGFDIGVQTIRNVYVSGETFDATVTVKDPSGKNIGTKLKLDVLEVTQTPNGTGERLVESFPIESAADTGIARRTIKLTRAGQYLLRASGTDQFGHTVSGTGSLMISGEDDAVRLRILADQHHFKVGDKGQVQLHWRDAPALALVTYEGAKVLQYELLELKTGPNPLDIKFSDELAPNFQLAVAVMNGHKFHEDRSDFRVARELLIKLQPKQTTARPGTQLPVTVTVTDSQGQPVAASLSLGLIQKNLLDRFPDASGAVTQFFDGGSREVACRAGTSCTFSYTPSTRPINEFLLAEEDRTKRVLDELAARQSLIANATSGLAPPAPMAADDSPLAKELGSSLEDLEQLGELKSEVADRKKMSNRRSGAMGMMGGMGGGFGSRAGKPGYSRIAGSVSSEDATLVYDTSGIDSDTDGLLQFGYGNTDGREKTQFWSMNGNLHGQAAVSFSLGDLNQAIVSNGTAQVPSDWFDVVSNSPTPLAAVNRLGELQIINGRSAVELKRLADEGNVFIDGQMAAETGYWNPQVITDKTGKTEILIQLPDRSTAWTLRSRGINSGALAGQAEVDIITQEDLFGELQTPLAFTAGDKAQVQVEVHNTALKEGEIAVQLKATIGEKSVEQTQTLKVTATGVSELTFPVEVASGELIQLDLKVRSGELTDTVQRVIPIVPHGLQIVNTAGGSAAQNTSFTLDAPAGMKLRSPQLQLLIGPNANRTLIEAVLGNGSGLWERGIVAHSPLERAISDVLGGVSVMQLLGVSRQADTPEARDLAGKIQAGLATLIAAQREDGGWNWAGGKQAPQADRNLSSRVLWAFSAARAEGFAVPQAAVDKAIQYLHSAIAASPETDYEIRSVMLQGLAEAGAADFSQLNRLHRSRNSMSASALLHTALALIRADRKQMAQDLLTLAKAKLGPLVVDPVGRDISVEGCQPWMQSGVELRGLYLLAANQITPNAVELSDIADWLLAARNGNRWLPEKANGPVIRALCDWNARVKFQPEKYTLTIYANEKLVTKLPVDPMRNPSHTVEIPADLLVADKPQKINIDIDGRGRFHYVAILAGFVPAEETKPTTNNWHFHRNYEPAQRMLDGEPIPRGFGHIQSPYESFQNPLTQLPVGERGEVSIYCWRQHYTNAPDEHRDYLIYTEPLPAGATVLTDSISGDFERYEIGRNEITFYIGDRPSANIHFAIVGYLPGEYLRLPATLRSFYRPAEFAVQQTAPLTVLARGEKSKDEYRLTPIELYELGKRHYQKRDLAQAYVYLSELVKKYRLVDNIYGEVVQMLFAAALEAEKSAEIVQYFEIIKEKLPTVEVSFENILRVAQAYVELGEYERSYLVYRATLEAAFLREAQIAGFLDEQGEFLRSVQVVEGLLRSYPAEAYIATATYALAQEVYGKSSELANLPKLRATGLTRIDLLAATVRMLDHFLLTWPTDPAADQASFSLANALLDLEQYPAVVARCDQFAKRYPDSKLLDSFWYVIGYSQFAMGHHEEALAMCQKVADWKQIDPQTQVELAAANQWQAVYIMGQVYHSLGKAADAIGQYEKVRERFPDAAEAIDYFTRKELSLPEVTTVKPGDPAKLPLKFRNVTQAAIKVYRIDLLKFSLLNRNLSQITAINLAGIRPYHDQTLMLGNGKDYRDREQELELPLKEEGAYLVVGQGDNLYTSGLVLVSPLSLEVQEDAASGRVRVTVKDVVADRYAHAVHVKVIGSENTEFVAGQTDLRGIFIADGIAGTSTVIAKSSDSRYAFFRGKTYLGTHPQPTNEPAEQAPAAEKSGEGKDGGELLKQLREDNRGYQEMQRGNYRKYLKNSVQGVEASDAF